MIVVTPGTPGIKLDIYFDISFTTDIQYMLNLDAIVIVYMLLTAAAPIYDTMVLGKKRWGHPNL
jgi:hypothetical protein